MKTTRMCRDIARSYLRRYGPLAFSAPSTHPREQQVFQSIHGLRRSIASVATTALVAGVSVLALAPQPAWAAATGGSGASLPYVEVQAENSATNGSVIGPTYTQGQLADEASYRKA